MRNRIGGGFLHGFTPLKSQSVETCVEIVLDL